MPMGLCWVRVFPGENQGGLSVPAQLTETRSHLLQRPAHAALGKPWDKFLTKTLVNN